MRSRLLLLFGTLSLLLLGSALAAPVQDVPGRDLPPDIEQSPAEETMPEAGGSWLRSKMPDWLTRKLFLLENWQWFGLLLLAILGVIADKIVCALLATATFRFLKHRGTEVEPEVIKKGVRPFGLLAMALFWHFLVPMLELEAGAIRIIDFAVTIVAVSAGVWGTYRLVDILSAFMEAKAKTTESKFDDLLIPLVRKSLKIFIFAFGLVFIADNLEIDISSMLAGLGLGGLAFALAAKDTVANLFGSFTVLLDKPFQVGDWVIIDGTEGTVEEIAFRSTRLRTFYNSVITVPNSKLITAVIDNMGVRRYRRWKAMLGVAYETPADKIEALCEGIRELIRIHPYTRKDYFHVYVNQFSASSIDVLLYIFHETPDWGTELRERHRLMLDILRLANRMGVVIAYPTTTVFHAPLTEGGAKPDLPKAAKVEKAMAAACKEARAIAQGELGGLDVKPPAVSFAVSEKENRGEGDEESGDGNGSG